MFIELTEILVCPVCREREAEASALPAQGLVARVDRLDGRRVLEGFLGCPHCEVRFPIRGGVVRFAAEGTRARRPPAGPADPEEAALLVPALLALQDEAAGYVLLGRGLTAVAGDVAAAAEGVELVALTDSGEEAGSYGGVSGPDSGRSRVSLLRVEDPARLPLFSGRLRGIALVGGDEPTVREAGRILEPGGRLAILVPSEEAVEAVERGPLRTLAAEPRALVAVRP